ncbi:DUF6624 domain-containing protein [Hymenobacter persicinus]|uniref:Tetratricopeptide repeat protein n=1 Tax=Hymenobacter persicinus TaxID=2025506 RepID=A0A4Q5LEV3_9BACT|nr:DUF6624 domain-containing protein [Hymenobacter persicinus]RYU81014.1 hypothetical protein EWM57_07165 [Hymenobacter persicinus]
MHKITVLLGLLLLPGTPLFAQNIPQTLSQRATAAYKVHQYQEAGQLYDQSVAQAPPKLSDLYNAACSWALAGNPDKAFSYLDKTMAAGYGNLPHLVKDTDLASLHSDPRWAAVVKAAQQNADRIEARFNQPLKRELEQVFADHRQVRAERDSLKSLYGANAPQTLQAEQAVKAADARQLALVLPLLDQQGWPTKQQVGHFGSLAPFLVIQQANIAVQAKYLPMIRQATLRGDLSPFGYLFLQDQVLVRQGKPQLFGTQMVTDPKTGKRVVAPIEDEVHVDERRAVFGQSTLAEYIKLRSITNLVPSVAQ